MDESTSQTQMSTRCLAVDGAGNLGAVCAGIPGAIPDRFAAGWRFRRPRLRALKSWGLSKQIYAVLMTGMAVITVVVYWILVGFVSAAGGDTDRPGGIAGTVGYTDRFDLRYGKCVRQLSGLIYPSVFLQSLGMIGLALFLFLFPNGRFYPRYATIPFAGAIVIILIRGIMEFRGHTAMSPVQMMLFLALIVLATLGPVFQILRYRRDATPLERQQTKWALYGFFVLILGFPLWMIITLRATQNLLHFPALRQLIHQLIQIPDLLRQRILDFLHTIPTDYSGDEVRIGV